MSFSVFYKFKNSKEPERIVFDGTGISVFELKREIILASGLGDGSDFDLHLYPEDQPSTEYDDDTTVIPRSSTVIAVRRPAAKGHGRAARYVSGRAPVRAIKKADPSQPAIAPTAGGNLSEQDAEAAFLAESAQVWDQQKESLSHAKPVYHKKKPVNVPTHEPPPGYVCYRCQKKGHWIQACPTNDDPDFKPVARAKRTTGIPRSFLKTVEKPVEGEEDARGVMLNADGEYVQVLTDTRTWEKFQEKAVASKAQAANADAANKEMEERGIVCPVDKRMYVDPVKTPCCEKTYCHDCIENALADGDLVCPNCATEGVLIDDLVPDEEMVGKIRAYQAEKSQEKADKEKEEQAKEEEEQKKKAAEEAAAAAAPAEDAEKKDVSVSSPTANDNNAKAAEPEQAGAAEAMKLPKPDKASGAAAAEPSGNVKSPVQATAQISPTSSTTATTAAATESTPAAGPSTATAAPTAAAADGNDTDTSTASKKRKEPPTEIKAPTAPKAMRMQKERQNQDPSQMLEKEFIESMEALKNMPKNLPIGMGPGPNMPNMPTMPNMPPNMANMGPMGGMPMGMGMGMPMNPMMMGNMGPMGGMGMGNMGGMPFPHGGNGGWNQGFSGGNAGYGHQNQGPGAHHNQHQHQHQGQYGGGHGYNNHGYGNNNYNNMGGGYGNQGYQGGNGGWNNQQGMGGGYGNQGGQHGGHGGHGHGGFANQQQPDQQDAYERRPVNPHRAQNRHRKQRAPDFHYVG